MSFVHLTLKRIFINKNNVEYEVLCSDFSSNRELESIGRVIINKSEQDYIFEVNERQKNLRIIPPKFYSKSEEERKILLETEYNDYGCGAWSMRIDNWLKT